MRTCDFLRSSDPRGSLAASDAIDFVSREELL